MGPKYLGSHMSISGGIYKAIERAESIGCTAVQIFTANQRRWVEKVLDVEDVKLFREKAAAFGVQAILSHDSYLINLAAPVESTLEKSMRALSDEIDRCDQLGISLLVMHPGSHLKQGEEKGLDSIARHLDKIYRSKPDTGVRILLENTAGQGANLGYRFEHLGAIIERMDEGKRMGICFDTCHALAAGYDLRTVDGFHQVMEELDRTVGLDRLGAFHVNDSKKGLGSRVDRHDHIGEGEVGLEGFRGLMNDARFTEVPMVLETPKDKEMTQDVENLKKLRSLVAG